MSSISLSSKKSVRYSKHSKSTHSKQSTPTPFLRTPSSSSSKRDKLLQYVEKMDLLKEKLEIDIFEGKIPTYRILNKNTNQYFDTVLLRSKNGKQTYYVYDSAETNRIKQPFVSPENLDLSIYSIVKNSGFPIPENVNEMIALMQLNRKTLAIYETFIEFFDEFEEYKKYKNNAFAQTIQNDIKAESIFVGKITNNKIEKHVYVDIIDFLKIADDFKQFHDKKEKKEGSERDERDEKEEKKEVVLYRAIRDDNQTRYFPSFFKIGDIIPQYLPFSTSMQPEFPIYVWTRAMQHCCVLKIIVKDGLYGKAIPISKFSIKDLLNTLYKKDNYQSEITLAPGTFRIVNDENIVVPDLLEYKENLIHLYREKMTEEDYQQALKSLESIENEYTHNTHNTHNTNEHCRDTKTPFTKRLLTVEYTPYTINEFEDIYYMTLREDDEEDDIFYNQEEEDDEIPDWANEVYDREVFDKEENKEEKE